MKSNFNTFSFEFLNRGKWDKKTLALITEIGYKWRVKSKTGIKKKELCKKVGINPASFSRAIQTIESKTNQQFQYDQELKQITQAIQTYYKGQNQIHVQVGIKYIAGRMLRLADLTVYGYLKALGGSWSSSAYKLTKMMNKWLRSHKWFNLVLSYTSVLKSLKKLNGLNLINCSKKPIIKIIKDTKIKIYIYKRINITKELSIQESYEQLLKTMEDLNENWDKQNYLLETF